MLLVEFENGSTCSFTMVGGTSKAGPWMHICGTHGEIEGEVEEGKFILRVFNRENDNFGYDEEVIDVNNLIVANENYAGHAGGDFAIMSETVKYFNGDNSSVSITSISDSINGHLVVYASEQSVKEERSIYIK